MVVGADGSGLRAVVDANPRFSFRDGFYAEVSPEGSRIAYTSCQYTKDISENGKREGVTERDAYHYEIATVSIDGTRVSRLTENEYRNHYPTWSPDGSRIAFLRGGAPRRWPIDVVQIMSKNGSNKQDLVINLLHAQGVPYDLYGMDFSPIVPTWSPDGHHLAMVVDEYREQAYREGTPLETGRIHS